MILPNPFASALVVILGLVVGSFLNVVIHRLPLDQSIVRPRSHCPGCQSPIRWYHNIPLIGFLMLRGQCPDCSKKIHWRYPLVEFLTALLFLLGFRNTFDMAQIRIWVFIAIGIAITFIDFDHRIIPDELSLGGWGFGLLTGFWDFRNGFVHLLIASFAGFVFFLSFAWIYEKIKGQEGLGGGDIKYMGMIGAFLGLGGIWTSLIISSILGTIIGICVGKLQKNENLLTTAIPYGPFLVVGAFIELFYEVSKWMNV